MQIFDYHINPKTRKDLNFASFRFEPETNAQKKLGSLYIIAELSNFLSRDKRLLEDLSGIIKQEFYYNINKDPETALNKALSKTNQHLKELSKKGNVNWLGNLNVAIINIRDLKINFSKSGEINILLLRGTQYLNIAENLEFQDNTDSKKFFSNIASGMLAPKDKLIVLTQSLSIFFENHLAKHILFFDPLTSRDLNKLIKEKKEEMKEFAGILFLFYIKPQRIKRFRYFLPSFKFKKQTLLIVIFILILALSYLLFK